MILQELFENIEFRHKVSPQNNIRSCRSFLPIVSEKCLQYYQKKRVEPSVLTFPENEASELIFYDANKRHFHWSLMRFRSIQQSILSWTASRYLYATIFLF